LPKSIFLFENKEFLKCGNFGYECDKNDELLTQMLQQLKEDKTFNKYGLIKFKTCSKHLAERYTNEVDTSIKHLEQRCNGFITNNPLITENLKRYL
jgi:hypothetical protein